MWAKLGYAYLDQSEPEAGRRSVQPRAQGGAERSVRARRPRARASRARRDKAAADAMGRLEFVWSDAEPGLRWLQRGASHGHQVVADRSLAGCAAKLPQDGAGAVRPRHLDAVCGAGARGHGSDRASKSPSISSAART